ncbi:translation initiation factor 2 [Candidatus Endoriftia persephone]|jgi:methyl-accepting chemotaxis protein|uniref:Translation initiation factor 2 n=3 Tax=Gammaproteobacteria TaxID=1236 RepID=G2FG97_9GAMM|nr:translation initiation factor 2 [Candidatus Endoriftia persephone]EGW54170.1 hypothetical protein TevJSym_ap00370 [endosymbiont of Tevnia jerichonana (vent Tica)]USF88615.1 translation initiation factor 2 [Candidatus Endoriftia persephone]
MSEDPKRLFVQMVGRLGRETQFHLDERQHHFHITNIVLMVVSALLLVVAVFNVYYIHILSNDLNGIVDNMDSMHTNLEVVRVNMNRITDKVESIDKHMGNMDQITAHTEAMGQLMPGVGDSMGKIGAVMVSIDQEMGQMSRSMGNIDQRFRHMTGGVSVMRYNVRQMSRPMGVINPALP